MKFLLLGGEANGGDDQSRKSKKSKHEERNVKNGFHDGNKDKVKSDEKRKSAGEEKSRRSSQDGKKARRDSKSSDKSQEKRHSSSDGKRRSHSHDRHNKKEDEKTKVGGGKTTERKAANENNVNGKHNERSKHEKEKTEKRKDSEPNGDGHHKRRRSSTDGKERHADRKGHDGRDSHRKTLKPECTTMTKEFFGEKITVKLPPSDVGDTTKRPKTSKEKTSRSSKSLNHSTKSDDSAKDSSRKRTNNYGPKLPDKIKEKADEPEPKKNSHSSEKNNSKVNPSFGKVHQIQIPAEIPAIPTKKSMEDYGDDDEVELDYEEADDDFVHEEMFTERRVVNFDKEKHGLPMITINNESATSKQPGHENNNGENNGENESSEVKLSGSQKKEAERMKRHRDARQNIMRARLEKKHKEGTRGKGLSSRTVEQSNKVAADGRRRSKEGPRHSAGKQGSHEVKSDMMLDVAQLNSTRNSEEGDLRDLLRGRRKTGETANSVNQHARREKSASKEKKRSSSEGKPPKLLQQGGAVSLHDQIKAFKKQRMKETEPEKNDWVEKTAKRQDLKTAEDVDFVRATDSGDEVELNYDSESGDEERNEKVDSEDENVVVSEGEDKNAQEMESEEEEDENEEEPDAESEVENEEEMEENGTEDKDEEVKSNKEENKGKINGKANNDSDGEELEEIKKKEPDNDRGQDEKENHPEKGRNQRSAGKVKLQGKARKETPQVETVVIEDNDDNEDSEPVEEGKISDVTQKVDQSDAEMEEVEEELEIEVEVSDNENLEDGFQSNKSKSIKADVSMPTGNQTPLRDEENDISIDEQLPKEVPKKSPKKRHSKRKMKHEVTIRLDGLSNVLRGTRGKSQNASPKKKSDSHRKRRYVQYIHG